MKCCLIGFLQFLQFDFSFNINRTSEQEPKQCPGLSNIVYDLPRHLSTGIHKLSDESAKKAVNHFGIRKKKIKDGNKNRRQLKKFYFSNAVVQRLGSHILKKHPKHHPQKNPMSTKQEYYQRLKDAEVHDLSKYVFHQIFPQNVSKP